MFKQGDFILRYAFYISGKGSRLFRYLTQLGNQKRPDIGLVISDSILDLTLKNKLLQLDIPAVIFEYEQLPGNNRKEKNKVLSNKILEALQNNGIDYCFSFGAHLFSGELLKVYENRLINFHPSILLMYPGLNAIDQAVSAGNTFLVGNTAHIIDEGIDTGKIIMQSVICLESYFPSKDYNVILDMQIEMLGQLIAVLEERRLLIQKGRVKILGADYKRKNFYPHIVNMHFKIVEERSEKILFIRKCDVAFDEPICNCEKGNKLIEKLCEFSVIIGVYCNGEVSAYCAMYINDMETRQAYITMFAVHPDYQGLGIGQKLMYESINFAKKQGMHSIKLEVNDGSSQAIKLYLRTGYKFLEERKSKSSRYMIKIL